MGALSILRLIPDTRNSFLEIQLSRNLAVVLASQVGRVWVKSRPGAPESG